MVLAKYLSVFLPATQQERKENFDNYWAFVIELMEVTFYCHF